MSWRQLRVWPTDIYSVQRLLIFRPRTNHSVFPTGGGKSLESRDEGDGSVEYADTVQQERRKREGEEKTQKRRVQSRRET